MNYTNLLSIVRDVHNAALRGTAKVVNQLHVLRNWTVGLLIVEFEQNGEDRAAYGEGVLKTLSADLASKGLMGLGLSNLKNCRTFYRLYPQIGQTASGQFGDILAELGKSQTPSGLLAAHSPERPASSLATLSSGNEPPALPAEVLLRLSWSQFVEFIRLDDPWKRLFYENECLKGGWTVSELQRQIGSLLYERTGLSTDKQAVLAHAQQQAAESPCTIAEIIRDPYVLEFTGLAEKPRYLEKDLESALLDHLQSFLLELGTGFCFEARQRRVTIGNEHDYIDLVFYHRILRCHLLIDLKTRAFQHGDAGQMNFYLNFWKAEMMADGDQPPVGLILCTDRKQARVNYATAGMDQLLFVSRYLILLPSPEALQQLIERDTALWQQNQPTAE
ncbi:MAG TPA: PDDEXK nuclease domain-containing protein [Verrucomicrobiota bacterium]|nr:cytoplasmic protein [Verrucomicrobiales bacterium]HRI13883.1 PDDEXK nuclease domain-containing protein [Verrucomicrobiota bacterium]